MSYKSELKLNNIDLQSILEQVNTLPNQSTTELPTLSNPATADDVASGKQFIDSTGAVIVGGANIPTLETPEGYVKVVITKSGTASSTSEYIEIGGTQYKKATELIVEKGTSIKAYGTTITLDGNDVTSTKGYTFSANGDVYVEIVAATLPAQREIIIKRVYNTIGAVVVGIAEVGDSELICPKAIGKTNIAIIGRGDESSLSRYNVSGLYFGNGIINFSQNCFGGTPTFDKGIMTFDNTTGVVDFSEATYSGSFTTHITYYYIAW